MQIIIMVFYFFIFLIYRLMSKMCFENNENLSDSMLILQLRK